MKTEPGKHLHTKNIEIRYGNVVKMDNYRLENTY